MKIDYLARVIELNTYLDKRDDIPQQFKTHARQLFHKALRQNLTMKNKQWITRQWKRLRAKLEA